MMAHSDEAFSRPCLIDSETKPSAKSDSDRELDWVTATNPKILDLVGLLDSNFMRLERKLENWIVSQERLILPLLAQSDHKINDLTNFSPIANCTTAALPNLLNRSAVDSMPRSSADGSSDCSREQRFASKTSFSSTFRTSVASPTPQSNDPLPEEQGTQATHTLEPIKVGMTYDDKDFMEKISPNGQARANGIGKEPEDGVVKAEESGTECGATFKKSSVLTEIGTSSSNLSWNRDGVHRPSVSVEHKPKYVELRKKGMMLQSCSRSTLRRDHATKGNPWARIVLRSYGFRGALFVNLIMDVCFIGWRLQNDTLESGVHNSHLVIADCILALVLSADMAFRLVAYGRSFFFLRTHPLNLLLLLNAASVLLDLVFDSFSLWDDDNGVWRGFHVVRLIRIFRMASLIKTTRGTVGIRVLLISIRGTLWPFLGAMSFLFFVIYGFAVPLTYAAKEHMMFNAMSDEVRVGRLHKQFGTLPHSMISLFQAVSGGINWGTLFEIVDDFGPPWNVVFIFYIAFTSCAVLIVTTALFCQAAVEAVRQDPEITNWNQLDKRMKYEKQASAIFKSLCLEDRDVINVQSFCAAASKPDVKSFFEDVDVPLTKPVELFILLDKDDSGYLDREEFVESCLKLEGLATRFDFQLLNDHFKRNAAQFKDLHDRIARIASRVESLASFGACDSVAI